MPVTREQSERFVQERITFKTSHLEQSRSTATRGRSGSRQQDSLRAPVLLRDRGAATSQRASLHEESLP